MNSKGWAGPDLPINHHSANGRTRLLPEELPRNMTGIYVGQVYPQKSTTHPNSVLPAFVRGRGQKFRVKTPSEARRNKMVERLRLKEDHGGFNGWPLRRKVVQSAHPVLSSDSSKAKGHDGIAEGHEPLRTERSRSLYSTINNQEFIRTNPRQFTLTTNSGITHFEYLKGGKDKENWHDLSPEELLKMDSSNSGNVLQDMIGMQECYHNICNGRLETLTALACRQRNRRGNIENKADYTGLTIRSYRNPHKAELLPDFYSTPYVNQRTNTTLGISEHFYFPKSYKDQAELRRQSNLFQPMSSRSVNHKGALISGLNPKHYRQGHATLDRRLLTKTTFPTTSKEYADIKKAWTSSSRIKDPKSLIDEKDSELRRLSGFMPPRKQHSSKDKKDADPSELSSHCTNSTKIDQSQPLRPNMENTKCDTKIAKPTLVQKSEDIPAPEPSNNRELSPKPPAAPIMISLDDADGESKIVDIDDEELLASGGASLAASREDLRDDQENKENEEAGNEDGEGSEIKSLTKKSRSSEAIVASLKENAEQRQKDFEKLLDEHAVLVQEITRASSSDNLTQENTRE